MKRWCYRIALCLCVCLLTLGLCGRMEAAEVVDSGSCGENLTWSLDGDGVLTIRGTAKWRTIRLIRPRGRIIAGESKASWSNRESRRSARTPFIMRKI
ncbi:MAG: hypothetical protein U0M10_03265 [Oscillospiraceae bacterium]|nr:hypothetical protein [Oscillospiraceae bacterium]